MEQTAYRAVVDAVSRVLKESPQKFIDAGEGDIRSEPNYTLVNLQRGEAPLVDVVNELERAGYCLIVRRVES